MTQNYYLEYRFIPDLPDQVKQGKNPIFPGKRRGGCLFVMVLFIAVVSIIVLVSCGKKNVQPQAGPRAVLKEEVTHCGPYLSVKDSSYV